MSRVELSAWLLTYAVHSTLLIGGVWLLVRRGVIRSHHLQDTFWRAALVGGVLTATAQTALGIRPSGSVALEAAAVAPAPATGATVALKAAHEAPAAPASDRTVSAAVPSGTLAEPPAAPRQSAPALPASDAMLYIWLVLAAICVLQLVIARVRLSLRIGPREPMPDSPLDAHLAALRRAAGIRRSIRLTAADGLASPIALGRSEICIPRAVLTDLEPEQQRSVLAHELAHLTRFDPLWLTLACVTERVFFFQPLNRLARRRMQETAEYLCDDWAVGTTGSGLTMAKSLVKVAEWMQAAPLPLPLSGMAETPSQLVARVKRLVDNREPAQARRRWQLPAAFAVVGVTAVMVPGVRSGTPAVAPTQQQPVQQQPKRIASDSVAVGSQDTTRPRRRIAWKERAFAGMIAPTPTPTPIIDPMVRAEIASNVMQNIRPRIAMQFGRATEAQDTAGTSQRVAALVTALRDSDAEVRRAAANSLGQLDDKRAVPALLAALKDADAEVRQQSAWALGQLEDHRAVSGLAAALTDGNVDVRRKAAWALGQLNDESAASALTAALHDADADVRKTSAWSLGQLELRTAPPALIEALKDSDADVRRTAAWALSEMGDARAVPALRLMLNDADADARRNAIHALGQIRDSSAMQAIIGAMQSKDADVRRAAAQALGDR
jgi:beta-lactamase regulating signal transducer with metallopeptidase domain